MQEFKEFQGLDLSWMITGHETPKQDPSHLVWIDLQSYINNPTPTSLLPSNVVFVALTRFKRTPSLSIDL
jgi:hypothetical protein